MSFRLEITPQNFWLFFGGLWLFVGSIFLIAGAGILLYQFSSGQSTDLELPAEFAVIGGVVAAVGGTLIFRTLKKRKLDEALRRRGMPAEATITEIAPANIRINRVQQWAIHYRYQDAYGQSHTDSRIIIPEEAPQWQVGQRIAVRYDSQRPHLHVWIGPAT
ncbi:MAG: hypothetical protein HY208_05560 [Nitrospirae bacterium]|nr:hypothetical protein [Nitrospirota bacterium]